MEEKKYPHKILIIEDELAMQKALVDNLHANGLTHTMQAKDGEAGLALAIAQKPDLVILDLIMPKMDGMTVLKKIRENEHGKKLKVILLTNLTGSNDHVVSGIVHDEPSYFLVKTDHSIADVVEKVKVVLGIETL
jgi:DNA-binding response OmpR family regulator